MLIMSIKYFLLVFVLLLFTSCSSTGTYLVNVLAKLGEYQKIKNIPYNEKNTLDIYLPNSESKQASVVVFFYGGCWGACQTTFKEDYEFLADALTQKGYIVVIPNYRLYPKVKFQTIITDAAQAVEWVKNNISKYKGDNKNIFLMGHSSGAHLAIMLSVKKAYLKSQTYSSIKGAIGLAGPYDFIPYTEPYLPGVFGKESKAAYSQPINFIQGDEPALLLIYGKKDTIIKAKNIINMTKKIKEKKGEVKAVYYKNLAHIDLITGFTRPFRDKKLLYEVECFIRSHTE